MNSILLKEILQKKEEIEKKLKKTKKEVMEMVAKLLAASNND
jgi:hypothetical protein